MVVTKAHTFSFVFFDINNYKIFILQITIPIIKPPISPYSKEPSLFLLW